MYQVTYPKYQVSAYLCSVRPKRNYSKVPKYYGKDCLKNLFPLYPSNDNKIFQKKYQFSLGKVSSFRQQLISIIERLLNANFDLN